MNFEEFQQHLNRKADSFNLSLGKYLIQSKFRLERRGKEQATEDFYQAVTRSGKTRDYNLTGRLRSSIVSGIEQKADGVFLTIQAGGSSERGGIVDYADDLEFGTAKIKPYFFLKKSLQKEAPVLIEHLKKFLQLHLKEV